MQPQYAGVPLLLMRFPEEITNITFVFENVIFCPVRELIGVNHDISIKIMEALPPN